MSDGKLLKVSPAPHIRDNITTQKIMGDVLLALTPAVAVSVVMFGFRALLVILVCAGSSVLFEYLAERVLKRDNTVYDLSACVTGVILALNLPYNIPIWQCVVGSLVAIIIVKQLFGGIGRNFANPAATARIFMMLAFASMSAFTYKWAPMGLDGQTSATPLAILAGTASDIPEGYSIPLMQLFVGSHGGVMGETSALAIIIGFLYLLLKRVISWETTVSFVAAVFVLTAAFGLDPVRSVLSGGLLFGAVFMATDYATTPITFWGRVVFGLGAGFFTAVIRSFGSYAEGVSFAILLMNILTPYINRAITGRPLGASKTGKAKTKKGGKL